MHIPTMKLPFFDSSGNCRHAEVKVNLDTCKFNIKSVITKPRQSHSKGLNWLWFPGEGKYRTPLMEDNFWRSFLTENPLALSIVL